MHFARFYPRILRNFYSRILFPDHPLLLHRPKGTNYIFREKKDEKKRINSN